MKISELMTRPVHACRATDTLDLAARLMWENDIGSVVVTDDTGQVVGMVTDRDACMAALMCGARLHDIPVATAMAKSVVTCRPNDSDTAVAETMAKHKIRRIPVVDDSKQPVGVVSLNDLARTMARGRDVPSTSVAGTLAAISEHRVPDGSAPRRPAS
jgi:CBS domain-containing protein